jgi:sterol desaturase/sphingolipid hydroxylase (fatty acid hydroxylase superfamily)
MISDFSWLWSPFTYLQFSGKRIFYIFLISSFIMVLIRTMMYGKNGLAKLDQDMRSLFGLKIWSHSSSFTDIKCLFINNWLSFFIFSYIIYDAKFVLIWLAHGLDLMTDLKGVGQDSPQWLVTTLYTVVLFLVTDFSRFILHYALHRFHFLWRFHKVHHSAEVLTPLTVYRAHPIEMLLYRVRSILVVGVVSGVFYFLFLGKMRIWDILGVSGLGFLFNFFGSNLRHSQVWLGFGKLEYIFISPAQHQMHHNKDVAYSRRNIGSCLAFWDQLFGTFRLSVKMEQCKRSDFGLNESVTNHDSGSWFSSFWKPFLQR